MRVLHIGITHVYYGFKVRRKFLLLSATRQKLFGTLHYRNIYLFRLFELSIFYTFLDEMPNCIYSNSYVHFEEIVDIFEERIKIINDYNPNEQQNDHNDH